MAEDDDLKLVIVRPIRSEEAQHWADCVQRHHYLGYHGIAGKDKPERVAAAIAVLRHLAVRGCLTLAATHDSEIAEVLADQYACAHFDSVVSCGAIAFDYRLRPGIITSNNGILLLESIGYPQEVTQLAPRLAECEIGYAGRR